MNRAQRRRLGIERPKSVRDWVRKSPKAPVRREELVPLLDGFMRDYEDRRQPWRRVLRWLARQVAKVPGGSKLLARIVRKGAE